MTPSSDPLQLSSYGYDLPQELIAQDPARERDHSRLFHYEGNKDSVKHSWFYKLPELLQPGDLLVLNDSKVYPARIYGQKSHTGTTFEFLLTQHLEGTHWQCIAKNKKRIKEGHLFQFPENIVGQIKDASHPELLTIEFIGISPTDFHLWLDTYGEIPYPPYINQSHTPKTRYQTVYSGEKGSLAAPTAGLHFTPELLATLDDTGISHTKVTLHVGLGTFSPVRSENILDHNMHSEVFSLSPETAERLNAQKSAGKRIIAVGTTTTRVLESVYRKHGRFQESHETTDLFIYPGQDIQSIDGLITNFHLPYSSLLMLVGAWVGHSKLFELYAEAIEKKYRFYSYGDAMLLL